MAGRVLASLVAELLPESEVMRALVLVVTKQSVTELGRVLVLALVLVVEKKSVTELEIELVRGKKSVILPV